MIADSIPPGMIDIRDAPRLYGFLEIGRAHV